MTHTDHYRPGLGHLQDRAYTKGWRWRMKGGDPETRTDFEHPRIAAAFALGAQDAARTIRAREEGIK